MHELLDPHFWMFFGRCVGAAAVASAPLLLATATIVGLHRWAERRKTNHTDC